MIKTRKIGRNTAVVILGIVLAIAITMFILGTQVRIERRIKLAGPDEPVYYMIMQGDTLAAIEGELRKHPQVVHDGYMINSGLLGHAAGKGRTDVVRLLLETGADPNGLGRLGEYTPLAMAVAEGQQTTARILIAHGAGPDLTGSPFGSTPRQLAEMLNDETMLSILAERDDNALGEGDSQPAED